MKKSFFTFIILLFTLCLFAQETQVLKTCNVIAKCILEPDFRSGNYTNIKIKKGESVDVLNFDDSFYKVRYKGKIGFINEVYIYDVKLTEIINKIEKTRLEEEYSRKEVEEEEMKRQVELTRKNKALATKEKIEKENKRKQRLIEKHGAYKGGLIADKQIRIGWSEADALESWGMPDEKYITVTSYGTSEQWVYSKGNYKNKYLYFENDILKTIQK